MDESGDQRLPDLRKVGLHPDFWYPLAVAKDLRPGRMLARTFAGTPIVLARTLEGQVFALEDRCAHKQLPLSLGRVCADRIQCSYHGWLYRADGSCEVPYKIDEGRIPRGVRAYPTKEAYGLVFVYTGHMSATLPPLPDLPEALSPAFHAEAVERYIECHYSFMHENLMDMSHQFLHRRWMGRFNPAPIAVRTTGDSVEVDYAASFAGEAALPHSVLSLLYPLGRADDASETITVSTNYPYQSLVVKRSRDSEPIIKLWLCYIPADARQSTNRPTGVLFVRKPKVPLLLHGLRPLILLFLNAIYREDKLALEAEQRAFEHQGGDWNQEVRSYLIDLRELLRARGTPISA